MNRNKESNTKKVLIIKQHLVAKLINGRSQRNKHQKLSVLLFNDMINIEVFDSKLLKLDKELYKSIDIYYIGYITIKKKMMIMKIFTV